MKRRIQQVVLALLVCAVALTGLMRAQQQPAMPGAAAAAEPAGEKAPTLKPGDPAPALAGGKWLKGEPIDKFQKDKIYVVEFWATWCGPCIQAIPHVSEMQAKYEKDGVNFIGQNVWERDAALVEPFVQKMGEKMSYRVRMDDVAAGGKGKMAETWMEAAGQDGIPCSFLIGKDGKVAWIGHPMALEPVLKKVIAGTFDIAEAAKEKATEEAAEAELQKMGQDLQRAVQAKDYDAALKVLDTIESKQPALASRMDYYRFQLQLQKKDYDTAYKTAAKLGTAMNDNPQALNDIAWTIVAAPGLDKRDLDLAEKLATRAVELTEHKEPSVLDTLARVEFEKGQIDKAIEVQTEAVSKSDPDNKAELQESLEKYKKAKAEGGAAKPQ